MDQATADRPVQADMRQLELQPRDSVQQQLIARLWRLPPGHPSSPYDGDGRLRPPEPDWREWGRPLAGEEGHEEAALDTADESDSPDSPEPHIAENEQAERVEPPDHDPHPDQEVLQAWRDVVSSLRGLWQKHEEKWPENKRPAADRSNDEPGSWRGDSGFMLRPQDNKHVADDYQEIASSEEQITDYMTAFERGSLGQLVGLDNRLKEEDRYKEKVAVQKAINPDADVHEVVASIHDGVRYTLKYDEANYSRGVIADVHAMKESGFELMKLKNLWDAPEYKGINSQWREPGTSQVFELQFHTLISFEAKQLTHSAYERLRTMGPGGESCEAEAAELHEFQRAVCVMIPIPSDALDIPDYPRQENR